VNGLVASGALWAALPVALLAGLISFLSPCVLPLVPGYLGFLGGTVTRGSGEHGGAVPRGRLLLGVLLFILGFTAVFVVVIVLGGFFGGVFMQYQDLITRILGVVVILMGLVFIGQVSFLQRTVKMDVSGKTGLVGAPLLGIALGVGWTPCMGPTLATIMSVAWGLGDPGRAAILGIAYSLGLGIPFILLALGLGWASKSVAFIRKHIRVVNIIGGVLLIIVGLLMVLGVWTMLMTRLGSVMSSVILPL
jgi:cytochrome c-type biogenesis protein